MIRKKLIKKYALVALTMACIFMVGCGEAKDDNNPSDNAITKENSENEIAEENTAAPISFEPCINIKNVNIYLNDDMASLVESIGEPTDYSEAPSCLGAGLDKSYFYGPIYIETRPDGDKDLVFTIEIAEGGSLPSGVVVGTTTKEEVMDLYGENITDGGNYLEYVHEKGIVDFELENDIVSYIEIIN